MQEFEGSSKGNWLQKVEADLKGKSLESLNWTVTDDLAISPFAHPDDIDEKLLPIGVKGNNNWRIGQEFEVNAENVEDQNVALLDALNNGIEAPKIKIQEVLSVDQLERLFKDVNISYVAVYFSGLTSREAWTDLLKNYALNTHKGDIQSDKFFGGFHMDMNWAKMTVSDFEEMATFEKFFSSIFPRYRCFYVDGTKFYKGDSGIIEELAQLTYAVSKCYDGMVAQGYTPLQISKKFQIGFSIGHSYLLEIAKIRAIKVLMANICEALNPGHKEIPCFDCYVSPKSYQADSKESNHIRGTIAAMAGVIGAVGRLTIPPFDVKEAQHASVFQTRMATNVQQVIKLETKLNATSDPAAGSYYIEQLTNDLARKAWSRFIELRED